MPVVRNMLFRCLLLAVFFALPIGNVAFGQGFDHSIAQGPKPWTREPSDQSQDQFMFAIHSDLTAGERPRVFEIALAQLALLRPEFLISVGDLIEGDTDPEQLTTKWEAYDQRVRNVSFPVMYVSGNQDVSNDVLRALWAERYGPLHYHFRYKDVLFLVLDTEDGGAADSGTKKKAAGSVKRNFGALSNAQIEYLEAAIRGNRDVRHVFLFAHKPVWDHPDKVFLPIETALGTLPYTAFNGHFHKYTYQKKSGRDHIQLATTGGAQDPDSAAALDHVTLVTVTGDNVDIANLVLSGILDKTGHIPLAGKDVCFRAATCAGNNRSPGQLALVLALAAAFLAAIAVWRFYRARASR